MRLGRFAKTDKKLPKMNGKRLLSKRNLKYFIPVLMTSMYLIIFHKHMMTQEARRMINPRSANDDDFKGLSKQTDIDNKTREAILHQGNIDDEDMLEMLKITENMSDEERIKYWDIKIQEKIFLTNPPNPEFIFHNKLPKSGSSTMNNILARLSKQNRFNFEKIESARTEANSLPPAEFVKYVQSEMTKPFVLLKHHGYMDFAEYGWNRVAGCRHCKLTEEEIKMSIDECAAKRHIHCTRNEQYIKFLCGESQICAVTDPVSKRRATEISKFNILNKFYAVGILERFEDTLNMFDALLPRYYTGAAAAWKSPAVQTVQNNTKTVQRKEMSTDTAEYFKNGILKEEIEIYNFAKNVLERRLQLLNINPVPL